MVLAMMLAALPAMAEEPSSEAPDLAARYLSFDRGFRDGPELQLGNQQRQLTWNTRQSNPITFSLEGDTLTATADNGLHTRTVRMNSIPDDVEFSALEVAFTGGSEGGLVTLQDITLNDSPSPEPLSSDATDPITLPLESDSNEFEFTAEVVLGTNASAKGPGATGTFGDLAIVITPVPAEEGNGDACVVALQNLVAAQKSYSEAAAALVSAVLPGPPTAELAPLTEAVEAAGDILTEAQAAVDDGNCPADEEPVVGGEEPGDGGDPGENEES